MLGKLLKYEFMAEWKKYVIIFGGLIFLSLSMLFLNKGLMSVSDSYIVEAAFGLVLTAFIMLCFFALFIVFVFSTIRYYKNIFRDEGYLMNTLPCTAGQHLAAKIISTYAWSAATVLIIIFSISVALADFTWIFDGIKFFNGEFAEIKEEITGAEEAIIFEMFNNMTLYMIVSIVLCPLLYQIYLNFCIAVGSLFNTHKILMAVVTFVGVNVVSQIISTVSMFVMGYANIIPMMESDSISEMEPVVGFLNNVYVFSGVLCVIMYGAMLWVTHYIMSKKLNLA